MIPYPFAPSPRWLLAVLALVLALPLAAQAPNLLHLFPWHRADRAAASPADHAGPGERLAPAPPAADYVIGPGDVLTIDVWQEKEISQTLPVRPDGQIALPLAGNLVAAGQTPQQLQASIAARLAAYISKPVVTVMVAKVVSRDFSILGAVLRPGRYPLVSPTRVLQALAQAGGFTPFANRGNITLLRPRPDGTLARYRFNYSQIIQGHGLQQDRLLQPGDTLVVP
ncbi:MAG TPA: polysaccharide biosynthesis/export family protein [Terriglobales bacterium]|nr:polysaccharide biosynthesis/export family protein [Terriglobales bacterium]